MQILKENINNIEEKIDRFVESNAGMPNLGKLNLAVFRFLINKLTNYASRHNITG